MGYDMYIEAELTEAEELAKTAAQEQFDAAVSIREKRGKQLEDQGLDWPAKMLDPEYKAAQAEVEQAYAALDAADVNYFRLNIWGMGRCRGYMMERGMVYIEYPDDEQPEWPAYEEPERREGESEDDFHQRWKKYDEEHGERCKPVQSWSPGGEHHGIPFHKFNDNSGWLVTEEECASAAKLGREASVPTYVDEEDGNKEKLVPWWEEWLQFLERASTRGGFSVR
jgi:hypothetical protein